MTCEALLLALDAAGLVPTWTDAGLRLHGNPARFTIELKAAMKLHRQWLEHRFRPVRDGEDITGWNDPQLFDAAASRRAAEAIALHNEFVTARWQKKHGVANG